MLNDKSSGTVAGAFIIYLREIRHDGLLNSNASGCRTEQNERT